MNSKLEKTKETIKELKEELEHKRIRIVGLLIALIITIIFYIGAVLFYDSANQENKLICEYSHIQTEIINEFYPKWAKESCDEVYNLTILNKSVQDALCYQFSNIEMPDKFEC